MIIEGHKRRGRPPGYKMSAETKRKISESKTGCKQSEATKAKISNGVLRRNTSRIPIERIMATDLSKAKLLIHNRYVNVYIPNLSNTGSGNWMRYHVALIEQELGRKLLPKEQLHHWGEKINNIRGLLTLCKDRAEHHKLEKTKKNMYKYLDKEIK